MVNSGRLNQIDRLNEAMGRMIVLMQEIDDTCVQMSKDISKKELLIISFVGDKEQVIMKEIADYMGIAVSTTTGLVDKLVKKNYLSRQFSEEDRRSISIVLDSQGKKCFGLMGKMRTEMANRILDDLSMPDADCLIEMLEKVTSNLHKYVPTPQD